MLKCKLRIYPPPYTSNRLIANVLHVSVIYIRLNQIEYELTVSEPGKG